MINLRLTSITSLFPMSINSIMRTTSRSLSLLGFLVLLGNSTVFCEELRELKDKYLNAAWINKSPRPPVPAWPDQFTSDFYVYVEIYGEDFQSKGAINYDWTKKVNNVATYLRPAFTSST